MKNVHRRSGQVLLISLLIMATLITVVFTLSFTSKTDTQTTKLEEENQKALAAAEAAIQVALKTKANSSLGSGQFSGITGGAIISSGSASTNFVSPSIEKDGEYTFYLGTYTPTMPPTFGASSGAAGIDLRICFGTAGSRPALDIAVIKANAPKLRRYAVDPSPGRFNGPAATAGCPGNTSSTTFGYSYVIPGTDIGTDARLLIIKALYSSTPVYIAYTNGTTLLPGQGSYIQSTATTQAGVTKKIQLFQSYPQIPPAFFSTIF